MIRLPKETITGAAALNAHSDVYLESSHICIKKNTAERIFGKDTVVLTVFYTSDKSFMIAPASDDLFRKLHKATQQILKNKNAAGDRSISVMELLLDNDLDDTDRDLEFLAEEALHTLKIKL